MFRGMLCTVGATATVRAMWRFQAASYIVHQPYLVLILVSDRQDTYSQRKRTSIRRESSKHDSIRQFRVLRNKTSSDDTSITVSYVDDFVKLNSSDQALLEHHVDRSGNFDEGLSLDFENRVRVGRNSTTCLKMKYE